MGKYSFKTPEQYLFSTAKHVCGQMGGVNPEKIGVHYNSDEYASEFWQTYQADIIRGLSSHGPEALGRIIAAAPGREGDGRLCHWSMDQGKNLDTAERGKHLLLRLAAYAVGAKIADMVREDLRKAEKEEQKQDHELNLAMHRRPIPDARRYSPVK